MTAEPATMLAETTRFSESAGRDGGWGLLGRLVLGLGGEVAGLSLVGSLGDLERPEHQGQHHRDRQVEYERADPDVEREAEHDVRR
jgi:hypothetical protein